VLLVLVGELHVGDFGAEDAHPVVGQLAVQVLLHVPDVAAAQVVAFSVPTWRLRCRIAFCTALERTRSKFEVLMTRTKESGSTILNFRKNSIAFSGPFTRVGQRATGAR
jgi:hypothetical protein